MEAMPVTIVASLGRNNVIGRGGDLAWRDRADLQRVRQMTTGHGLVMGRRTFDSIGKPLPGRQTVVITRRPDWSWPGVERAASLTQGIQLARLHSGQVFIFGGGQVYAQAIALSDRLELTLVHQDLQGDVHFPPIDPRVWLETARVVKGGYDWVSYLRQ